MLPDVHVDCPSQSQFAAAVDTQIITIKMHNMNNDMEEIIVAKGLYQNQVVKSIITIITGNIEC